MCKIGVVAICADLCHSAYEHIQNLSRHGGTSDDGGGIVNAVLILMDLAFHVAALITLARALRGRVDRKRAGGMSFAALLFKLLLHESIRVSRWALRPRVIIGPPITAAKEISLLMKSGALLLITGKLAFGADTSYLRHDEWFPSKSSSSSSSSPPPPPSSSSSSKTRDGAGNGGTGAKAPANGRAKND